MRQRCFLARNKKDSRPFRWASSLLEMFSSEPWYEGPKYARIRMMRMVPGTPKSRLQVMKKLLQNHNIIKDPVNPKAEDRAS